MGHTMEQEDTQTQVKTEQEPTGDFTTLEPTGIQKSDSTSEKNRKASHLETKENNTEATSPKPQISPVNDLRAALLQRKKVEPIAAEQTQEEKEEIKKRKQEQLKKREDEEKRKREQRDSMALLAQAAMAKKKQ